jgi:hypothetical protein
MKLILVLFAASFAAFAQPISPTISTGPNFPSTGLCNLNFVGNLFVRSEDPANGPIQALRCTQTGPRAFDWQPIGHFVGATLPSKCAVGDVAFDSSATAGLNWNLCTTANTWTATSSSAAAGWSDNGTTLTATIGRTVTIGTTVVNPTTGTTTAGLTVGTSAISATTGATAPKYSTAANCSSAASPAVCAAASAGSIVVAAAATDVVVNTTAVTANSQIFVMPDSSLGTKLSVTCNTTPPVALTVTARTAGTSFTITSTAPVTDPLCLSFFVVN